MKKKTEARQLSLFSDEDFDDSITTVAKTDDIAPTVQPSPQIETKDVPEKAYDHTALFERLAQSDFRRGFHLHPADIAYIQKKGLEVIRQHAADFVAKRLAPAYIPNDGKQTPMRGHPVFLAQHATGCCCRGCFFKWHHIPAGQALTSEEQHYAVSVLMTWIIDQLPSTLH